MNTIPRAFPVKSKEAILEFAKAIDEWSTADKKVFMDAFGNSIERWYYQELDGKPHLISIAEIDNMEGYKHLQNSDDLFTVWFRQQVVDTCGIDLTMEPKGPATELMFEFHA